MTWAVRTGWDPWLEALESLLAADGVLEASEVDDRMQAVLTTPRDMHYQRARREPVTVDPGH